MTPSQLAALRERFEAFVLRASTRDEGLLDCNPDGSYKLLTTTAGWAAWQGATYLAYQAAQPSLLELRDKLVGEMQVAQHTEILHGSGAQISVALHEAISIITSGFAPYVKGE